MENAVENAVENAEGRMLERRAAESA